MIRSKPKQSTIMSLGLFLLLAYGATIWSWLKVPESSFYWYLLPISCLIISLLVTTKLLSGYQVVIIDGDRWLVKKLFGKKLRFQGKSIDWWREIEIKTAGSVYKQLHVHTDKNHNLKLSLQEHTEYHRILKQLRSKYSRRQIKETN